VTQYSYDMNGNLKTITEPSGEVITNNYSNDKAVSVLKGAANLATSINYKPFGGISSLNYGNGIAGSLSYDNQYRVTGITAGAAMSLSYPTYDANGNITAINNVLDATKNKSFGYDTLDRLSTATASGLWGSLAWTYDGVGNRLTENSNSYAYTTGTNKLIGAGGASFGFDSNGNTTSQGARQYTYNQNQRLVQVVDGAMTATYTYDGNGQRVKKVVNGVTTIFHYNERGQLIAESNGSGAITAVYVYLNGQPLAKIEGTSVYYYHNDALGTPQKMTDASGTVVWSADYKPFGEATITVSTITNNLRFPGQYFDAETGLLYNLNRVYNPAVGRYDEADPLLLPFFYQGRTHFVRPFYTKTPSKLHEYLYAASNPVNLIDPSGLQTSGGTGTCQPDTCQAQADAAYNNCMTQMRQGPQRMSTTTCVILAAGAGVGAGLATRNPVIGGIIGTGLTIVCFTIPQGIEDPALRTGDAYCGMLRQRFYDACEASR
jgi:RHS repeat-associated protein